MFCSDGEADYLSQIEKPNSKTEEYSGLTAVFFNIANSISTLESENMYIMTVTQDSATDLALWEIQITLEILLVSQHMCHIGLTRIFYHRVERWVLSVTVPVLCRHFFFKSYRE